MKPGSGVYNKLFAQRLITGVSCYRFSNIFTHGSISFDIFHPVIIHDTQITATEGFCHSFRYFCFCFYYFRTSFLRFGFHFLFGSDCHCTAFLCFCLRNILVRISLINLQSGADVLTYVNIRNIDRQDFESRSCIQSLAKHEFGDRIRIFEY